jgi:TatD DNase family protein
MSVDSHCHLDYDVFQTDFDDMLMRAKDNHIDYMMTIGVELSKMPNIIRIAEKYPHIFATAGIHPHEADNAPTDTAQQLRLLTQHPKIVGIGETGLDYFYEHSDIVQQKKSFQIHIEIAQETGLPLIIHTRDAEQDTVNMLQQSQKQHDFKFLIHCFTGTQYLADACLELGGYISVSGILTFKTAQPLRDVVQNIPLERLMVETDSPYLTPMPHRGKRNEPAFTKLTLEKLSEIKNISVADLDKITTENYFTLFQKAQEFCNVA